MAIPYGFERMADGNVKWSRSVIEKNLSNGKYLPYVISIDLCVAAQFEKDCRTNIQINNDGSTQRKTTRYRSQKVLSGFLVCAKCGSWRAFSVVYTAPFLSHFGGDTYTEVKL